jgi:phosphoglycerate dehydrogenase-like enzyme
VRSQVQGWTWFEVEPLPPDSPLWEFENVFLTPRIAGSHVDYVDQFLTILEPNLRYYLDDGLDRLINVVERS